MRGVLCALLGFVLVIPAARADVISDLIRKKQIERFASQERFYDPVPVIVPNHFRREAQQSDMLPGFEVMDCHRRAWTDRRAEYSDLYLTDTHNPQLRREAEAGCLARKRLRILHR